MNVRLSELDSQQEKEKERESNIKRFLVEVKTKPFGIA
jgi:hypothetical protein